LTSGKNLKAYSYLAELFSSRFLSWVLPKIFDVWERENHHYTKILHLL
jgi:hypothetical protein